MNPWLSRSVVIRQLESPPNVKLLLHSLNSRSDVAGICWPSLSTLELDTGLSRSTIVSTLHFCRSRALVIADRSRHNTYTLTLTDSLLRRPAKSSPTELPNPSGSSPSKLPNPSGSSPSKLLLGRPANSKGSGVKENKKVEASLLHQIPTEGSPPFFTLAARFCPTLPRQTILTWFTQSFLDNDTLVVPVPAVVRQHLEHLCSSFPNVLIVEALNDRRSALSDPQLIALK